MLKTFIPEAVPGLRKPLFLVSNPEGGSHLFQTIPRDEFAGIIREVPDVRDADVVIAPHEYADLLKHPAQFEQYRSLARDAGKRLLLSAYQDDNAPIRAEDAIVLRPGAYRSKLAPNEVIMPPYIEDIGKIHGILPLGKGDVPTVGFVGKAGFAGARERVRYAIRNFVLQHGAERTGVYFRRHALKVLKLDSRIRLSAIVRSSFSANRKTVEVPPEVARREYIDNIKNNLFTLAPRGDGNFSFRFFEALSAGRIPVLIETDNALPLEDRIKYDEFIVRCPWQHMSELPERIYRFWSERSDSELRAVQQKAREAFETYLYAPAFFRTVFTPEYLSSIPEV